MDEDAVSDQEALFAARDEVAEAIRRYADGWSSTEGGVVTKFIALAEVAAPDGQMGLVTIVSANATTWDQLGMLHSRIADIT